MPATVTPGTLAKDTHTRAANSSTPSSQRVRSVGGRPVGRCVVGVVSGSERTPRITTLPGPSGSTETRVHRQASARNRADFWYSSSPTFGSVRARTITPN